MNLKNVTLVSSIALGLIAATPAAAQRSDGGRAGARAAGAGMQPSISAGPRSQFAARNGGEFRGQQSHRWHNRGGDGNWRNREGGDRWRNRDGHHRWGNHNHWRHRRHHHPRYYPRYYGGFYGYRYGGYGYPFGRYGYGYPYFGSSAALYYNGYHPQYTSNDYAARGGSVTAEVQQELARAGYYRGAIDGVIGNGTRSAIRAYERAKGLRVDGRIDQELLSSMRIG